MSRSDVLRRKADRFFDTANPCFRTLSASNPVKDDPFRGVAEGHEVAVGGAVGSQRRREIRRDHQPVDWLELSPGAVFFRRPDFGQPGGRHASSPGQPRHAFSVDFGPDAAWPTRREEQFETPGIENVQSAVDPSKTQGLFDRFGQAEAAAGGPLLVDHEPGPGGRCVEALEPATPAGPRFDVDHGQLRRGCQSRLVRLGCRRTAGARQATDRARACSLTVRRSRANGSPTAGRPAIG